jgi:hypothetical protein
VEELESQQWLDFSGRGEEEEEVRMEKTEDKSWRRSVWEIYQVRPWCRVCEVEGEELRCSEWPRGAGMSEDWATGTDQLLTVLRSGEGRFCVLVVIIDVQSLNSTTHGQFGFALESSMWL